MQRLFRTLIALHGSAHGVALGFTLGLILSLVPIPVVGMLVALALAPLVRANLPATYLGTAVVNPVTGAVIYFGELCTGLWLLGRPLPSWSSLKGHDAQSWWHLFVDLLGPFFLGAMVFVAFSSLVAYPAMYFLVRWLRRPTASDAAARLESEERAAQDGLSHAKVNDQARNIHQGGHKGG